MTPGHVLLLLRLLLPLDMSCAMQERADIVRKACPGPGACGGMYTANTMATATEATMGYYDGLLPGIL